MSQMIDKVRKYLSDEMLLSIPLLLLVPLVLALMITGGGFFVGKVCSPWTLRAIWIAEFVLVSLLSWRQGLRLFAVWCAVAIATAFTFSYTGTDALAYHFPTQDLLINGWNPVFDSSLERFDKVVGGLGLSRYHTLFLPKINALCGALVALSLNTYSGDSFLNYVLMICLFSIAYRFATSYWSLEKGYSWIFALICTFSTKVTSFLAGQVDYVSYSSLCIAVFGAVMWIRGFKLCDLLLLVLAIVICLLSKSTGLVCGVLLWLIVIFCSWRRQEVWVATACICIAVLAIGASPLLTAWIQYGSPVYPNMTFDPTITPVDITSDFTSNADGDRMGYLARIAYAWISPRLTEKLCAIAYGRPDFHPEFYVCGGVSGLGMWFNCLLLAGVIALLLAQKNVVLCMIVFIFVSGNLAPLKYIGYNRYFPQMWIVPALAFFNLLAMPRECKFSWLKRVMPFATKAMIALLVALSILSISRTIAYQFRLIAMENFRREQLNAMADKSLVWQHPDSDFLGYSISKRTQQAGLRLSDDESKSKVCVDYQFLVVSECPIRDKIDVIAQKYPMCDSPIAILRFPWCSGIGQLFKARPLFR